MRPRQTTARPAHVSHRAEPAPDAAGLVIISTNNVIKSTFQEYFVCSCNENKQKQKLHYFVPLSRLMDGTLYTCSYGYLLSSEWLKVRITKISFWIIATFPLSFIN